MAGCKVMASREKELRAALAGMQLLHTTLLYVQYLLGPPSWSEYEGKSVVGCADIGSRPNDAFMSSAAPRAIGHSDKFCVWSSFSFTALPVQYYSSLAVHAKIGGDKIVGASVLSPSSGTFPGHAKPRNLDNCPKRYSPQRISSSVTIDFLPWCGSLGA